MRSSPASRVLLICSPTTRVMIPSTVCPAAAQQRADRGLVGVLREPAHHVFEVAAVPGLGPGPGHRLGAHPSTASAVQPTNLRLQPHLRRSPVQVPPPAHRPVIHPATAPATRTHRPRPTAPKPQHQPVLGERNGGHRRPRKVQHLVECRSDAHVTGPFARQPSTASTVGPQHVRVTRTPHRRRSPTAPSESLLKPRSTDPQKAEENRFPSSWSWCRPDPGQEWLPASPQLTVCTSRMPGWTPFPLPTTPRRGTSCMS